MRYYIFRNNTLEPLFGNLDARYSGYGDISSLEEGADRYIWFYQVPFGFDRCRVAEEVLSYIDKLRWVIEKIPAHKSVLVFSLVDLCPFQWAGSEWEVQESIETYNKYLRSLASERSNVRYVDLPDFAVILPVNYLTGVSILFPKWALTLSWLPTFLAGLRIV